MIMTTEPVETQPTRRGLFRLKGPNGRFIANSDTAQLDAYAVRLRSRAMGFQEIADEMGEALSTAHLRVQRGLAAIRSEPAVELVKLEVAKLDALERAALSVLEAFHYVVSEGRVVSYVQQDGEDPAPLRDDGPVLAAVRALESLSKTRQELLGLKAAQKVDLSGGVTYTFENVSAEDL